MFGKGSKLYSILFGVCPKCHSESMYSNNKAFSITAPLKMNKTCSCCGLKYEMEPSFFYGSMYVSYAVSIAFAVVAFVLSYQVFNTSLTIAFIAIVVTLVALMPVIMRLSRNIWINLFVKYDKTLNPKNKQANV